jgi:protein phosphatase
VLREQENLTETQLRGHPNKNLVTQTLGIGTPEPSSITEPLRRGDWLLLCSDGLNDELEDAEIAKILRTHNAPDAAADALIAAALAHGGRDNVSAVLVEYDGPNGVSFEPKTILSLAVLGGACTAILLAILWWWFYGR